MTDLVALQRANAQCWAQAKPTRNFGVIAQRLVARDARLRYEAVSAKTGVPWPMIAVIHERECSQDWTRSLAQGDPWDRESVHVPAGRGPFKSWEDAAVDALNDCAPYAGRNKDWSIAALLTKLEQYNGLGYAARGLPSPYLWAGTDQYRTGKYVRDGVFDPGVVDNQPGCAGLLMAMAALDPSITFPGTAQAPGHVAPSEPAASQPIPSPSLPKAPSLKSPARGSVGAFFASTLAALIALFKSKGK